MKYCKRCINPGTRPGIQFDAEGICPPCRFAEQWDAIDWAARRKELDEVAAWGRAHSASGYDCIVTVSGGKDSMRQALYVRDELGLKPLLVCCSYSPEQLTERGAYNLGNLISLGFDCVTISPDPIVWKELMRQGFFRFGNFFKSTEMALYASGPRAAIAYQIPLVFYGENPAITLGEMRKGFTLDGDGNTMKYSLNTLDGGNPSNLMPPGMTRQDVIWYYYNDDDEIKWSKMRLIYLGYYVKDFNQHKNAEVAMAHGLKIRPEPPEETGDIYGYQALDEDFIIVNQMIKYIKFGFGRATETVLEAIRCRKMTREEGFDILLKYDGVCHERYVKRFCRFLGITETEFWDLVESYRNKDVVEKVAHGKYRVKGLEEYVLLAKQG
jgi:N-acetyl sugar amidotransferase